MQLNNHTRQTNSSECFHKAAKEPTIGDRVWDRGWDSVFWLNEEYPASSLNRFEAIDWPRSLMRNGEYLITRTMS